MRTPEDVFGDFMQRRKGILKALTTECVSPPYGPAFPVNLVVYACISLDRAGMRNKTVAMPSGRHYADTYRYLRGAPLRI